MNEESNNSKKNDIELFDVINTFDNNIFENTFMEPYLEESDKKMFYNYLNNAEIYFEFGSGGSTVQASIRNNIKKIYSVESDIKWLNKLKKNIDNTNIKYLFNDMDTIPNKWGYPGKNATEEQKISYSNQIVNLDEKESKDIDLIMIDGRFRVACCLKCHNIINDDCLIAFDDFLCRPYYHLVLDYFEIIDKTDNRMVILKKIKNKIPPDYLIKKYELIEL